MKILMMVVLVFSGFMTHAQEIPQDEKIQRVGVEGGSDIGNSTDDEDDALMQSLVEGESFVTVIHSVKGRRNLFSVMHPGVGKVTVRGADQAVTADLRKNLGLTRKLIAAWDESDVGIGRVAPLVIYRVSTVKK